MRPTAPPGEHTPSAVVLVPGYGGEAGHLATLRRTLSDAGFGPVITFRYSHVGVDIPAVAAELVRTCDAAKAARGAIRVHLIGHSLGGVIMRYATEILGLGADGSVGVAVTVSAPHRGAPFALWATTGFSGWTGIQCGLQLLPGSALLREIEVAAAQHESPVEWLAFSGDADRIVPPHRADLAGADNIRLPNEDHFSILRSSEMLSLVVQRLVANDGRSRAATATPGG